MSRAISLLIGVKNNRGATAIIIAICLLMLIGFAALAIDVGHIYATRNELQNVADAAALAGAGYLGSEYLKYAVEDQENIIFNRTDIVNAVNDVAQKNKAAKANITILDEDIVIGNWNGGSVDELAGAQFTLPDAIQVTARRDDNVNNPISNFFAGILGFPVTGVIADATAALTSPASVAEGEVKTPFGISEYIYYGDCHDNITFNPTGESCAGWHNFTDDANAEALANKLLSLIEGHDEKDYLGEGESDSLTLGHDWLVANWDVGTVEGVENPAYGYGEVFHFIGGNVSKVLNGDVLADEGVGIAGVTNYNGDSGDVLQILHFPDVYPEGLESDDIKIIEPPKRTPGAMKALFDYFRYRDGDGDNSIWTALVPVYQDDTYRDDEDDCANPTGALKIITYATIEVTSVLPPPDNTIVGNLRCTPVVIDGRGGGVAGGNTKGSIPNLVE